MGARAVQALKRKKMYEGQRDTLMGTKFNVEGLAIQQEQAEITRVAVEAMAAGQQQLKAAQGQMSVEKVGKIMDDIADTAEEAKYINEALAQPSLAGADDQDELEAEFARLEEEAAMQKLLVGGGPAATPAAPAASQPAPASA